MNKSTIERFSRQMLVPGVGLAGQKAIQAASVLIVGAGGLGCPVAMYLAATGVGHLKVCDGDTVEASNLPRQVLHREASIGMFKAESIAASVKDMNSGVRVEAITELITAENILRVARGCQVIVDATDNVVTRYLLNDAAVILKIPLVSGAALGWDGQVSVFGNDQSGPCYRCLYPQAPPPEAITNCDLGGVIGPVTGLIGSLQALQVLRILAGLKPACTDSLFTFAGDACEAGAKITRQLKLRPRNPKCLACGDAGPDGIYDSKTDRLLLDYSFFCHGARPDDKNPNLTLLSASERITATELRDLISSNENILLIDVRPANQFEFCSIANSLQMPLDQVSSLKVDHQTTDVIFICRRGNDSQLAVQQFRQSNPQFSGQVRDLIGGLRAWASEIDEDMPIY